MDTQQVVVSGMRPTGRLHLGHYFGVLQNWLKLQESFRCYFFVADWHALTTEYAQAASIKLWSREIVLDWLAVGLRPERATIFLQSKVPQHAELQLLLGMITPLSWLERVPSYKELKNELKDKDLSTYGFLGYPLLQTADVAIYKANLVPVGQDQVAHLELSREVLRRFNSLYQEIFPEPQPLLTAEAKLPGLDGRKMSKSYGNSIYLSDPEAEVRKKLMACVTDPQRLRRSDPGNPEVCNIYAYHKVFTPKPQLAQIDRDCRTAQIGCVDCKKIACATVLDFLKPIQEKRQILEQSPEQVDDILQRGAAAARVVAAGHLAQTYEAMGL